MKISYDHIRKIIFNLFTAIGADKFTSASIANGLSETSLRGVDSHGIRLLPHYVNSGIYGRKNLSPNFVYSGKYLAAGCLDADDAYGHAAGFKAIDIAMKNADQCGVAMVSVKNSSHPGAMASFVLEAAKKDYIALAFTHADSLLLNYGGVSPYFGTNPIAMAAPRYELEPFCLDMAPTFFSWNKVKSYAERGVELPEGIVVDKDGEPTTDPKLANCLIGIGNYKGYGLAAMGEVLCGVLSGMNFGINIPSMFKFPIEKQRKLGQFYLVMRTDISISSDEFKRRMTIMSNEIYTQPGKGDQQVILPGDKEIKTANERLMHGIPVSNSLYNYLMDMESKYQIGLSKDDFVAA